MKRSMAHASPLTPRVSPGLGCQSPITDHRSPLLIDPHDQPWRVAGQCLMVIFVVCSLARTLLPEDPPIEREISATPEARRCVMHYTTRYQRDGRPIPVRYSTCTAMREGRAVFVTEGN